MSLHTDKGVFSADQVDRGTSVLLNMTIPPSADGDLLDLGCGYGAIAVALATRFPDRQVWAVDINERALALTRRNVDGLGLTNVTVCHPDEVPADVSFGGIYSNPPIKVGKKVLHPLLLQWLSRVVAGGSTFLVVSKHLGSDSLAKWLTEQSYEVARITSSAGYRILRVRQS